MSEQERDFIKIWSEIVERTWDDPEFKQRVVYAPAEILAEHGIELPEGQRCEVIEGDAEPDKKALSLPLPSKPAGNELSDADLAEVAGGASGSSWGESLDDYLSSRLKRMNFESPFRAAVHIS